MIAPSFSVGARSSAASGLSVGRSGPPGTGPSGPPRRRKTTSAYHGPHDGHRPAAAFGARATRRSSRSEPAVRHGIRGAATRLPGYPATPRNRSAKPVCGSPAPVVGQRRGPVLLVDPRADRDLRGDRAASAAGCNRAAGRDVRLYAAISRPGRCCRALRGRESEKRERPCTKVVERGRSHWPRRPIPASPNAYTPPRCGRWKRPSRHRGIYRGVMSPVAHVNLCIFSYLQIESC